MLISLESYAKHVYQYTATPATAHHLHHTVFSPLGLPTDAYESVFATPPLTTNVRFAGPHITSRATGQLSRLQQQQQYMSDAGRDGAGRSEQAPYEDPALLQEWGLPYCFCVRPRLSALSAWPPVLHAATTTVSAASPEGAAALLPSSSASTPAPASSTPTVVLVDVGCAEAVLRGSDVYAPGILTASRPFGVNERVVLGLFVEREVPVKPEADDHGGEDHRNPVMLRCALATGATLPSRSGSSATMDAAAVQHTIASADGTLLHFIVCLGEGVTTMDWKTVMSRAARGVAVQTSWTPLLQPSRPTLHALLGLSPDVAPDALFLQNYSSMIPVALLVHRLPSSLFQHDKSNGGDGGTEGPSVLDACAAPGGKTSLLLSLLTARAEGVSGRPDRCCVTCCERSRQRFTQMVRLLEGHFADETPPSEPVTSSDAGTSSLLSRILRPRCVDANKLGQTAASPSSESGAPSAENAFDAALVDPPCTGMGLRPKLLPHPISVDLITSSADYQRKLFDSAVRRLRPFSGGDPSARAVIVYSTCTVTLEENEANVLHFLRTYPRLRLARATTPEEEALCALTTTRYANSQRFLLEKEIEAEQRLREVEAGLVKEEESASLSPSSPLLVLRFMPRCHLNEYGSLAEDGVGFFVAVFEYGA